MKRYISFFVLLLVIEIAIATFNSHQFIRGFVGDVLVIPLLYSLLKMSTKLSGKKALGIVLAVAFLIEILQLFHLAESLDIKNKLLRIVIGTTFDGWDLVAYWFGIIPVLLIEKFRNYETT